jgi:DNA-binding Lrp family transcriptional regulator
MTREITYQKVLLAVYVLSDGLICRAFNKEIAEECGHSSEAVRRSLAEMERRGVVEAYDTRHGLNGRAIILMDHQDGPRLAERIKTDYNFRCRFGRA